LNEEHQNLVIIDTGGFEASSTIESPHPYESFSPSGGEPHIIFSGEVDVIGASNFIVNFDVESYIHDNDMFYIFDNAIDRNVLFNLTGNDQFPGVTVPSLDIPGPSLYVEFQGPNSTAALPTTLATGAYGVKLYVSPVMEAPPPSTRTLFQANTAADRGGGMFLATANPFSMMINARMESNRAAFGGGAVYMNNGNEGVVFYHVYFVSNEAGGHGGAIYYSMSHSGHQFLRCLFSGNTAVGDGGGMLLGTANGVGSLESGNELVVKDCTFRGNAATNGGVLSANVGNVIFFSGCEMMFNSATGSGGSIIAQEYNSVTLVNSLLYSNTAVLYGGGLDAVLFNTIFLEGVNMTNNFVNTSGGGLAIRGSSAVSFAGDCRFEANRATVVGGAVSVLSSALWSLEGGRVLVLKDNSAARGSAMFFTDLHSADSAEALHDIVMTGNSASIGGTVYWLFDSSSMTAEPPGLDSSTVHFGENDAVYGERVATQAVQLVTPSEYVVQAYGTALDPPIVLQVRDFYGQVACIDGGVTSVTASALEVQEDRCNGSPSFVSGGQSDSGGVMCEVKFSQLLAQCYPNGSLILQFDAQFGNLATASPYDLKNYTTLQFLECQTGEIYANGVCVPCPRGTFSLEGAVTEETACQTCTSEEGVDACWADQIVVSEVCFGIVCCLVVLACGIT
jgi:hypothetical protein